MEASSELVLPLSGLTEGDDYTADMLEFGGFLTVIREGTVEEVLAAMGKIEGESSKSELTRFERFVALEALRAPYSRSTINERIKKRVGKRTQKIIEDQQQPKA